MPVLTSSVFAPLLKERIFDPAINLVTSITPQYVKSILRKIVTIRKVSTSCLIEDLNLDISLRVLRSLRAIDSIFVKSEWDKQPIVREDDEDKKEQTQNELIGYRYLHSSETITYEFLIVNGSYIKPAQRQKRCCACSQVKRLPCLINPSVDSIFYYLKTDRFANNQGWNAAQNPDTASSPPQSSNGNNNNVSSLEDTLDDDIAEDLAQTSSSQSSPVASSSLSNDESVPLDGMEEGGVMPGSMIMPWMWGSHADGAWGQLRVDEEAYKL